MNLNEQIDKMIKDSNAQLQEKLEELGSELSKLRDIEKQKLQLERNYERICAKVIELQNKESDLQNDMRIDSEYIKELEGYIIDEVSLEYLQSIKEQYYR